MSIWIDKYGHIHRDGDIPGTNNNEISRDTYNSEDITQVITEEPAGSALNSSSYYWGLTLLVYAGIATLLEVFAFSKLFFLITSCNTPHAMVATIAGGIAGFIGVIVFNIKFARGGETGIYTSRDYVLSVMFGLLCAFLAGFAISIIVGLIFAAILVIILLCLFL